MHPELVSFLLQIILKPILCPFKLHFINTNPVNYFLAGYDQVLAEPSA
jgi:hypothetical protein